MPVEAKDQSNPTNVSRDAGHPLVRTSEWPDQSGRSPRAPSSRGSVYAQNIVLVGFENERYLHACNYYAEGVIACVQNTHTNNKKTEPGGGYFGRGLQVRRTVPSMNAITC